jgi:hypothetical protein
MFLDVARTLGIQGIGHVDYESTKTDLKRAGLALD